MLQNYEYRFELKPGKFIYLPTEEARKSGAKIVRHVLDRWSPAEYFYHFGKRGGHIAALRPHIERQFKASVDLKNFFTSVSRTKVHRALKSIGYANRHALDLATDSCVESDGRKFLPYGFVQSMCLATLAVEKSALGSVVADLRGQGIVITFYVDDILLSHEKLGRLEDAYESVREAIANSNLHIAEKKCSKPSEELVAFNCRVALGQIEIIDQRMEKFHHQLVVANEFGRAAILRYVGVVNDTQKKKLASIPAH